MDSKFDCLLSSLHNIADLSLKKGLNALIICLKLFSESKTACSASPGLAEEFRVLYMSRNYLHDLLG